MNPLLLRWDALRHEKSGPAILACDGSVLRTWGDIEEEAQTFRRALPIAGPVVGVQARNHPSFPALLLAVWRAGGAVCLLDPDAGVAARDRILHSVGCDLVVNDSWTPRPLSSCDRQDRPDACLFKVSSGTTGEPKVLAFTGAQLAADADQIVTTMGLQSCDRNLAAISFSHSYGFSNLVTPLLLHRIPAVLAPDAMPAALRKAAQAGEASVLPLVPAIFRALAESSSLSDSVRLCLSAGAPLEPALAQRFHDRLGRKIHSFYGSSECGGICYDASPDPVREAGYVGTPLLGVSLEFSDSKSPSGAPVRIKSAAVGLDCAGGVFVPPDLLAPSGEGYRIVGRVDDLIIVGGRKVAPLEVEAAILACPGVVDVAVIPGDRGGGEGVVIAVVSADPDLQESSLRRHCAAHLAAWQVPRAFFFVPRIPRNARGKVARADLDRIARGI